MKILLVTSDFRPESGWGTYSNITARGLLADGHEVVAAVQTTVGEVAVMQHAILPAPGMFLMRPWHWVRCAFALSAIIRDVRPDVIHFLVEPYVLLMPIVRLLARPTPPWVMNLHATYGVLPFVHRRTRWMASRAYRQCAGFLACSRFTADRVLEAVRRFGRATLAAHVESATQLFRFGIPVRDAIPHVQDPQGKRILFVGAVKKRKGVLELIQACSRYYQTYRQPFILSIVGSRTQDDAYQVILEQAVREAGLQDRVLFRGHVSPEEMEKEYAYADVFVMLSKNERWDFEGFGLSFLEANMHGIPCIGSAETGCKEAVSEGVSGFTALSSDTNGVADLLHRILDEGAIDRKACRAWALEHSIERQISSTVALYARVMPSR